jgi:TPR repeat protein
MNKKLHAVLSILLFLAVCPGVSHAGSWNKPTPNEAFSKGDYQTALRGFTDRAMLGEEAAQDNVGMMYAQALGTERDFAKAANQGNAFAQEKAAALARKAGLPARP